MGSDAGALAAHGLSKRFKKKVALDAVDLTVPAGSVTALVGPNGAGKTTLIRVCMAFERPNSGRVEVDGVDPWKHRSEALRRVGYVPQTPAVYRGLSVQDHLAMARSLHSGFDSEIARRRLDQLGIPLEQRADTLSGGQAAQLGLAVALGTRARILLLDEPLANLDPLARREFIQVLLDAVRTEGSTALLSSHIVTDVEDACDRLRDPRRRQGATRLPARGSPSSASTDRDRRSASGRDRHRLVPRQGRAEGDDALEARGRSARRRVAVRLPGPAAEPDGESASLEDVVLGYLAAGRGTAGLQLN